MYRHVLIGAGFTKGFGGYVACEINDRILNQIHKHDFLSDTIDALLTGNENYEEILGRFEDNTEHWGEYEKFLKATLEVFEGMDGAICQTIKGQGHSKYSNITFALAKWLARSDANSIFSLNQDLFFERFWRVTDFRLRTPGVNLWQPQRDFFRMPFELQSLTDENPYPKSHSCNLLKLHGSINWQHEGKRLFISGRNKLSQIGSTSLLNGYLERFSEALSKSDTEVLVIGYGFADIHVNRVLLQGLENGCRIKIIDPNALAMRTRLFGESSQRDCHKSQSQIETFNSEILAFINPNSNVNNPWAGELEFLNRT